MIDFEKVEKHVVEGYISKRKHPTQDLWIFNYTNFCQINGFWNKETLSCRGLIVDKEYNIIARPFKKFFNYEEHKGDLGVVKYVSQKMDGSLGILYKDLDGNFQIATRGSFDSEQAVEGTKILYEKYGKYIEQNSTFSKLLDECNETLLFEIIYPENKIVVDYGDERDLKFLGKVNKETGEELPPTCIHGFNPVDLYHEKSDNTREFLNKLKNKDFQKNQEGYVVVFEDGLKLKIKFEEYIRLHRIISLFSKKYLIDALKNEIDLDLFLEGVPDEFFKEIRKWEREIRERYDFIERTYRKEFYKHNFKSWSRKDCAEHFKTMEYPSILFNMLDDKCFSKVIWKIIEQENKNE